MGGCEGSYSKAMQRPGPNDKCHKKREQAE